MAKLYINPNVKKGEINKEIYGHFSEHLGRCIYEGLYVGENSPIPNTNGMRNDVVEALKAMKIPVLRWPGGCFADEYHWEDGIGPKETRKKLINTHWGGVLEDNSFGTEEYMELCRQLECETFVSGNLGSGTVREMSEWVEYMTFDGVSPMADKRKANGHEAPYDLHYFGIGNENWGCGGNMTADFYANLYRQYQTYVRQYRADKKIYKIACGSTADDLEWSDILVRMAGKFIDGLSIHYYTLPYDWDKKGSSTEFNDKEWYMTLKKTIFMEDLIKVQAAIVDKYDKDGHIGLIVDEWGTWYDCEPGTNPGFLYQQNTMRDALVAGINLNLFNKYCNRVKMANIAQIINVLQAVILTEGEKMILTPTYHVFKMYSDHQEAELVESSIETKEIGLEEKYMVPNIYESVSIDADNKLTITLTNLSLDESYPIDAVLTEASILSATGEIISGGMTDHNTFDAPEVVTTKEFKDFEITSSGLKINLPATSVVKISATLK